MRTLPDLAIVVGQVHGNLAGHVAAVAQTGQRVALARFLEMVIGLAEL